jgi:hypothetical protein
VAREFYRQVPQAILRAILAHMKLTDADELDRIVANGKASDDDDADTKSQRRKTIPLTEQRIDFLMGLLDVLHKPV